MLAAHTLKYSSLENLNLTHRCETLFCLDEWVKYSPIAVSRWHVKIWNKFRTNEKNLHYLRILLIFSKLFSVFAKYRYS